MLYVTTDFCKMESWKSIEQIYPYCCSNIKWTILWTL